MNSHQFITHVSTSLSLDAEEASNALSVLTEIIKEALMKDEIISLPGFGKFRTVKHDEYVDIKSGKRILFPPRIEVEFEAGNILSNRIKDTK